MRWPIESNRDYAVSVAWLDGARLIRPDPSWQTAILEVAREFEAEGDPRYPLDEATFGRYLAEAASFEDGSNLAPERVRQSEYWLIHKGRWIGGSRLRHQLIPALELDGGNIGYDIRKSERQKGYGHRILQLTLLEARRAALSPLLLTCEVQNLASARIIEAAGGVETEGSISGRTGNPMRRFWIDLLSQPS